MWRQLTSRKVTKMTNESRSARLIAWLLFTIFATVPVVAQVNRTSPDRLWKSLDPETVTVGVGQLSSLTSPPRAFRPFHLDRTLLSKVLSGSQSSLSSTNDCQGVILSLPTPDTRNVWLRFCVTESPIMEPELAAKFPTIKTYEGQGLDDRSVTARLDWGPKGLHAMVLSSDRTFFIDPLPRHKTDLSTYMSYFDKDSVEKPFHCYVETTSGAKEEASKLAQGQIPSISNGDRVRRYRLAVAATGEYTRFHGGTVSGAFSAIVTTINRVNAIYGHELAIQFVLVKNQDKIIYQDPLTDPYSNNSSSQLLNENQKNLDKEIGNDNYDIGHVFGTGGGGLAALGVVGRSGFKARGETGSSSPKGDPFDVDFVAHEIGHQFGANHTFNGTTANCRSNRNPDTAFEPGSGSTIMGYAGICGDENLQLNSDPYFHAISLYEILTFVDSEDVKSIPTVTPTLNKPPVVQAQSDFLIPKKTPFTLTASATDPNQDAITFSWEEMNLGREAPPNDDDLAVRPIYRAFSPVNSASRTFPSLGALLNGQLGIGEGMPTKNRTMSFRVTARDNRAASGGFHSVSTQVSVVSDSGPFLVTVPAKGFTWRAGSTQTVNWDVAGTSAPPINCKSVRILISTDGGKTFQVAKASTPNSGTATVVVPQTATTSARVKVESVSNVFFALSTGDFSIVNN